MRYFGLGLCIGAFVFSWLLFNDSTYIISGSLVGLALILLDQKKK